MDEIVEAMEFTRTCPYWKRLMEEPMVKAAIAALSDKAPSAKDGILLLMGMAYASGGAAAAALCKAEVHKTVDEILRRRGGGDAANG